MRLSAIQKSQAAGRRKGRSWRGDLGLTVGIVLIFTIVLVDTPLNPLFWLRIPGMGLDSSVYGVLPRDAVKDRFLAEVVPSGAALAASNQLAPHLSNRHTLYLLRYPDESEGPRRLSRNLVNVDYVVSDALFDLYLPLPDGYAGGLSGDREALGIVLRDPSFGLVAGRDGLLLFQRNAPANRTLTNTLALLPDDGAPAKQTFGQEIALVRHSIEQVAPRRLRASFTWRLTGDLRRLGRFVAVSRLEGVAHARIVHLPAYALYPAWEWEPGPLVQETFEIELPADVRPDLYTWRTGWYNIDLPASYATDERTLLPASQEASLGQVAVQD